MHDDLVSRSSLAAAVTDSCEFAGLCSVKGSSFARPVRRELQQQARLVMQPPELQMDPRTVSVDRHNQKSAGIHDMAILKPTCLFDEV